MLKTDGIRILSFRVAITLACLVGAGTWWPTTQTASAQLVRRCTNTGCDGIDRCTFWGSINCSMALDTCTNTRC